MKIYLKLLRYAGSLRGFLIPFIFTSFISGVFGVLNLVLLKPLLDVLFSQVSDAQVQLLANSSPEGWNLMDYYQKFFAQKVLAEGKMGGLKFICTTILCVSFVSNVSRYFSLRFLEKFKSDMVSNLRQTVFNHAIGLHLGFFTQEKKGELISRVTTDVQEVENSIANSFSAGIKELILLISYLIALFWMSWELTLFSLVVIPITGIFLGIMLKRMRHNASDSQQRLSNLLTIMDEAFGSMRVIKGFLAEKFIIKKFETENQAYRNAIFSYSSKRELANPFSEFISTIMIASLLFFGGSLILKDDSVLTASGFIAYIALFSQVVRPAKDISQAFSTAQRGLASGKRVINLLEQPTFVQDKIGAVNLDDFNKDIVFENVVFSYLDGKKTLHNINLEIPKGKTIALVGASGGGKSTIADLSVRFYDVNCGKITIDGHDLRDLTQKSLRNKMGIVTQEPILYNDTIYNNIAFGRDCTEKQIIDAAKIANAYEFIQNLSEGLQTNIGDRGSKLSGGQRQRLSIARAVLLNPPILILDEATSALDTESEKLVQEALSNLMKNRTSLVIAHRLSTIQSADYIYVIQNGEIVEQGNHEWLNNIDNGYYRKLVSLQELA